MTDLLFQTSYKLWLQTNFCLRWRRRHQRGVAGTLFVIHFWFVCFCLFVCVCSGAADRGRGGGHALSDPRLGSAVRGADRLPREGGRGGLDGQHHLLRPRHQDGRQSPPSGPRSSIVCPLSGLHLSLCLSVVRAAPVPLSVRCQGCTCPVVRCQGCTCPFVPQSDLMTATAQ